MFAVPEPVGQATEQGFIVCAPCFWGHNHLMHGL